LSLLEIRGLRVVYPNGYEALRSIDLTAEAGEIVAVIGRSGAGKSTLLRCINRIQRPTEGSIVVDGVELTALPEEQVAALRRRIGFIWQEYNLVDRLPVITNVLVGRLGYNGGIRSLLGYFSRADREIAVRNLERVNLLHRAYQRADRLSGGEKQRVSIARAMTQNPRLLLADEPVASLDPELAFQVVSDIGRVARMDGLLTLISLHQVSLAKAVADRIVGVAQGTIVFDGPPSQLEEAALDRIYRFDRRSAAPIDEPLLQLATAKAHAD
jgi:phosphonate transport system ATP-binding protein